MCRVELEGEGQLGAGAAVPRDAVDLDGCLVTGLAGSQRCFQRFIACNRLSVEFGDDVLDLYAGTVDSGGAAADVYDQNALRHILGQTVKRDGLVIDLGNGDVEKS